MKLEGEFTVSRCPQEVYDFLVDPHRLVKCMTNLQRHEVQDRDHFTVTVWVGISHMLGLMTVKMEIVEREAPRYAKVVGKGTGIGSMVNMESSFALEEVDNGTTRVNWVGEARMDGRIGSLAGGLVEHVVRANLEQFIKVLGTQLDEGSAAE